MSTGAWVAIIIVVVIVAAALVIGAMAAARRRRLQRRFGPEYDRVVGERGSQLKAESELAGRERRVQSLNVRPLSDAARAGYASRWRTIQEQFVDQPENAVVKAQVLVTAVMKDRGYPTEGHDQMLADLSVEHASTLEQYRLAHSISQNAADGNASTEDLRQAMIRYRALFGDLLGGPAAQDESAVTPEGGAAGTAAQDGSAVAPDGGPDVGAGGPDGGGAARAGGPDSSAVAPEGGAAGAAGPAAEASAMDADPTGVDQAGEGSTPAEADDLRAEPARRRRR